MAQIKNIRGFKVRKQRQKAVAGVREKWLDVTTKQRPWQKKYKRVFVRA